LIEKFKIKVKKILTRIYNLKNKINENAIMLLLAFILFTYLYFHIKQIDAEYAETISEFRNMICLEDSEIEIARIFMINDRKYFLFIETKTGEKISLTAMPASSQFQISEKAKIGDRLRKSNKSLVLIDAKGTEYEYELMSARCE
jgi:hypothetical protein